MPERRSSEPVHVATALADWLRQSGSAARVQEQHVILEWETIVGAKLAQAAKPVRIAGGVLTIKAKNTVWRAELLMRRGELQKKANEYLKEEIVKKIVVK